MDYADEVTVLRRGHRVLSTPCRETSAGRLAKAMIGDAPLPEYTERTKSISLKCALEIRNLVVRGDNGLVAVNGLSVTLRDGEILGIAGISGNGQRELVQAIGGQREIETGDMRVFGEPFRQSRKFLRRMGLFTLPEEPLDNAAVGSMTVAENLALRTFDMPPIARSRFLLDRSSILQAAREAIRRFSIRTPSPLTPLRNLSGGNVQRVVLARDLGGADARILVVANPCFGLDFAAAAFVHNHLLDLRNRGAAVLLISEDLDELSKLADRIAVMSAGAIVHETSRGDLDLAVVGRHMGAHAAA
jgi:simple sugar transport system ATP-binding protein